MSIAERISDSARMAIQRAIADADGDEVVFVCSTDDQQRIIDSEQVARGSWESVVAPMDHMQRGDVVIHNHPSGVLRPSRADVSVAAQLADLGIGSYIVNNDVSDLTVLCEPIRPVERTPLDSRALASLIDEGGSLGDLITGYEPRHGQIEMLVQVAEAFNRDELVAVEAGTGVGKSFAYLIPALQWAATNDERVVITTATINLQQQLVDKDIPTIQRLLGVDVPVVLVKGRGNYLCRKRLAESIEEESLFAAEEGIEGSDEGGRDLSAVRQWAENSDTGSRSDLPFFAPDELWSQVNSDADSCTELQCRSRESCFFLKARREAAAARVLVANHHLLFIDLALRVRGIGFDARAILPPFQRLIFDEAHSIENSATSLFSESFTIHSIRKHTRRLRHERRGRVRGLLPSVRSRGADAAAVVRATDAVGKVEESVQTLNTLTTGIVEALTLRINAATPVAVRTPILDGIENLHLELVRLLNALQDVMDDDDEDEGGPFYDIRTVLRRLERLAGLCESFPDFGNHSDRVFWLEIRRAADGSSFARFISSPLDIREVMREAVLDVFDTAVFTSATLTVAEDFGFWAGRVGLSQSPREPLMAKHPSPFPYKEHVLVGVPTDAPEPGSPEYQGFLSGFVAELLTLTEGLGLVLFTSYQMLRETHAAVGPILADRGIMVLRQGDDDRARLLNRFKEDSGSVLFATESFWQGVDAPGDTLQVVVLCRLPFRVPTDPILMARTEAIDARGGNSFAELALPEAVMKFRQGFGRLMRRGTDRGVVIVTDTRVLRKSYGRLFLESIPETQFSEKASRHLLEDVERFLFP